MGEAKRKNQKREAIIAAEPRCIYCPGPVETLEHMPPMGMFRGRQRPGRMEYAACGVCNRGTRGSDAVAALMARIHPDNGLGSWQAKEMLRLISAVDAYAPGVREELSLPGKAKDEWVRRPGSGLLQRVVRVHADGPYVKAHLSVFGAKLAMALFREHVGVALPLSGAVWCQFSLNGGMTQEHLNTRVQILPISGTLRQGQKNVNDQFLYRYNCDERTVIAAVAQFHRGLWFTMFASSDPRIIELFNRPDFAQLPGSVTITPGGLLGLLATSTTRERFFLLARPDHALRLPGPGSTRHAESILPRASTVRDLRLSGGFGNNLCRRAGFGQHAQTSVARGYVPNDGGNHGHFSDPLGLLRDFDCLATSDRMERGRSSDQFSNGRGLPLFWP